MHGVIGLGQRGSPGVEPVLVHALGDPEHPVRYHALVGLAAVGSPGALSGLEAFAGQTPIERDLARQAMAAIRGREEAAG
jgi:hypothetical protein